MIRQSLFLKNKIQRQLDCNGDDFTFKVVKEDKYHQPQESDEVTIRGLYHETSSYLNETSSEGNIYRTIKTSQILTLMSLIEGDNNIPVGSTTKISGNTYKVTGIVNIDNLGVAADISLELQDSGGVT